MPEEGPQNHPSNCIQYGMICRMILHVDMLEYNPSLLGGVKWGGGSFARSQYPTTVYTTFFPNDEIHSFPTLMAMSLIMLQHVF